MTCREQLMREGRQCEGPLLLISRAPPSNRVIKPVEEKTMPVVQWRVSSLPTCSLQAKQQHGNFTNNRANEGRVECESCDGTLLQLPDLTNANTVHLGNDIGLSQHHDRWGRKMIETCTSTAIAGSTKDDTTYVGGESSSSNTNASTLSMVDACSLSTAITARTNSNDTGQDSSHDSTAMLRVRTEVMGAALRQIEPLDDHQGGSKVPNINICGEVEGYITVCTVPKMLAIRPQQDGALRDRRDWIATPHLVSPRRIAKRTIRQRGRRSPDSVKEGHKKVYECQIRRFGVASCMGKDEGALESRVASHIPAPSTCRPLAPLPICTMLRNRTLKVTRQDPCIFRRGTQCESQNVNVAPTTRQLKSWHIVNRRIFGSREVPRPGSIVQPEWMVFGGGNPPQGFDERKRWKLRLGRTTAETMF